LRKYCPNCGRPVSLDASICAACGSTLTAESDAHSEAGIVDDSERIPARDMGEIISETFDLYRDNFKPFLIIAMAPQIFGVLASFTPTALSVVFSIVAVVVSVVASGAAIVAVAQVVSGLEIDLQYCFSVALARSVNLIVAVIILVMALIGAAVLALIVVGIPLLFYLAVIWVFVAHAVILEKDSPILALGRSRLLVRGSWWRVFGILIVFVLICIGLVIAVGIPISLLSLVSDPAALLISPIAFAVIAPITYIGLTLLYFDLRVRKEGFTLTTLEDQMRRLSSKTQ